MLFLGISYELLQHARLGGYCVFVDFSGGMFCMEKVVSADFQNDPEELEMFMALRVQILHRWYQELLKELNHASLKRKK